MLSPGLNPVAPCLTPAGLPYLTTRGGPIIGKEQLALQGLPIDELLLTRETEDQQQEFSGNAMSTTVVGSVMIAAVSYLKDYVAFFQRQRKAAEDEVMAIDEPVEGAAAAPLEVTEASAIVKGEDDLVPTLVPLAPSVEFDVAKILAAASSSARLCICEGLFERSPSSIRTCLDCGHTACDDCRGKPPHRYDESPTSQIAPHDRLSPRDFKKDLVKALPMVASFVGLSLSDLERAREEAAEAGAPVDDEDWDLWAGRVTKALIPGEEGQPGPEFRFASIGGRKTWVVRFDAPGAYLELHLGPSPTWLLFVRPVLKDGAQHRIRTLLKPPVARLVISPSATSFLDGAWEVCVPSTTTFNLSIQGVGKRVPGWRARMGLLGKYKAEEVWAAYEIQAPEEALQVLDLDVSGRYALFSSCGTATESLHLRDKASAPGGDARQVRFFFDPDRTGPAAEDAYSFSLDSDPLKYGEHRQIVAHLDKKWRPYLYDTADQQDSAAGQLQSVQCSVDGKWVVIPSVKVVPPSPTADEDASVSVPRGSVRFGLPAGNIVTSTAPTTSCAAASAVVSMEVALPLVVDERSIWASPAAEGGALFRLDLGHKAKATFEELAWETTRMPELTQLEDWTDAPVADELHAHGQGTSPCEVCAPTPPSLEWELRSGVRHAKENYIEAGAYERVRAPAPSATRDREAYPSEHVSLCSVSKLVPSPSSRSLAAKARSPASPSESTSLPSATRPSRASPPRHLLPPSNPALSPCPTASSLRKTSRPPASIAPRPSRSPRTRPTPRPRSRRA